MARVKHTCWALDKVFMRSSPKSRRLVWLLKGLGLALVCYTTDTIYPFLPLAISSCTEFSVEAVNAIPITEYTKALERLNGRSMYLRIQI